MVNSTKLGVELEGDVGIVLRLEVGETEEKNQ